MEAQWARTPPPRPELFRLTTAASRLERRLTPLLHILSQPCPKMTSFKYSHRHKTGHGATLHLPRSLSLSSPITSHAEISQIAGLWLKPDGAHTVGKEGTAVMWPWPCLWTAPRCLGERKRTGPSKNGDVCAMGKVAGQSQDESKCDMFWGLCLFVFCLFYLHSD